MSAARARHDAARAARQRPGSLRRSRRRRFVVASEPYGVVEETARYVRLDGEGGGEIVVLDADHAGELGGVRRLRYDGTEVPVTDRRRHRRGHHSRHRSWRRSALPPQGDRRGTRSFQKTLRGKIVESDGMLRAVIGERALPSAVAARLAAGTITRVRVIGQGTAAVAGQSTAALLDELCGGVLDVDAIPATELSGFQLRLDMSDTLAIAVSQSGTTTDTNRTVDLLRARGAAVIGIVNRRASDLVDKADGILYTSDGRDVEMSVASTKAFYAQVAAGALLACAVSEAAGVGDDRRRHDLLSGLREIPRRDAVRARPSATRSPTPPAGSRRRSATGPSSATARTSSRPRRCGSSSASSATSRSPPTSPRTRSTSTCRRAADPGLRRRSPGQHGRRRRQGDGDLPGPQGDTDRHRRRGRGAVQRGGHDHRPAGRSGARVRAVGDGGTSLRLRGGARDRRVGATAARGPRDDRARRVRAPGGDAVLAEVRRQMPRLAQAFHDGVRDRLYDGHLEASTAMRCSGCSATSPARTRSSSTRRARARSAPRAASSKTWCWRSPVRSRS
jgi:glutamine---fructose-6-phosphate transaminase (isomerizing)